MRLLPAGVSADARLLLVARSLRALGDGMVAVVLPAHLLAVGFDAFQVGVLTTAALLGAALLTLALGALGHRIRRRPLLLLAAGMMVATGTGFGLLDGWWPLLLVACVGTLNPSAGDLGIAVPLEHALLAQQVGAADRTALFARYSLLGSLAAAAGALLATLPEPAAAALGVPLVRVLPAAFGVYALLGLVVLALYRRLPKAPAAEARPPAPLGPSRGIVYRLALLFSLDAFAGGFVVQSLLALWLFQRFGLSLAAAGAFFFWSSVLTAFSYLVAVRIARRIGLVNTMVFTHLPANLLLVLAPLMPTLPFALGCLMLRSALAQMDVPTRTSYVMAVVTPAERLAAASFTQLPRSLATALSPVLAGALLGLSAQGWPLVIGGGLKIVYDLLLLAAFRRVKAPEEP
ncbi:MAG: MFS transporter [Alphaproteobacteria bacterium]|nr:MFS transporter [Alphaproteobacteria bacterium]